jgi:hypothetical protein
LIYRRTPREEVEECPVKTKRRSNAVLRWVAGTLTLAWVSTAHAFSTGIDTPSFPIPAQGCNFCHSGGTMPTVTLECVDCGGAPPSVAPLSVHEFKLTVFAVGLQDHAGLNVSSPDGELSTGGSFAANTQSILGAGDLQEITHTAPKAQVGGMTEFSFLWTAPAAPTTATLTGWGNAVNFNGNTSGDRANVAMLDVSVGGDTPTPTDTPAANTPTPTPTPTPANDCPLSADLGCETGFAKGFLLIKESVFGKEKLVAKLLNGPALSQTDMGNPLDAGQGGTGTAYSLCVYDGTSQLAGSVLIDRAGDVCAGKPCWKPIGKAPNDPKGPGKGYKYKDSDLSSDGVLKLLYKGGDAGKSKAIVIGKGINLPPDIPAALQASSQVTVQLRSSDGLCLSVDLSHIKKQESAFFKAK